LDEKRLIEKGNAYELVFNGENLANANKLEIQKAVRNIIFDWSGTLSDNIHAFHQACNIMFHRLGGKEITLEEIRKNFTLPYMKFWNKYFPDLTKEEQDRLYKEAIHKTEEAHLYDGSNDLLLYLHSLGMNLFVLSSDPYSKLIPEIKKAGVFDLFKEIHGEAHEKQEVILRILEKHSLSHEETIYVGDTTGDIEAGKVAGVRTIGITWGFQHKDILKQSEPDFLIDDISEMKSFL
ncbi:MAG: HAD family hydrolase, partial [Candidatus Aenigmarchaeota archaeon]|nr:HAD family hydrolase [Candidatus Aenigmarchaeota archaeon]MDI6721965.1 HAD family hydrolase [Candidatus Aenigmarchaeota archaeon]